MFILSENNLLKLLRHLTGSPHNYNLSSQIYLCRGLFVYSKINDKTIMHTICSLPSVSKVMHLPDLFRPVRPSLCMNLIGDLLASKQMIKSTSPISKPSSATLVAINTLKSPHLKRFITCSEKYLVNIYNATNNSYLLNCVTFY